MQHQLDWLALEQLSPLLAALPEPMRLAARHVRIQKSERVFTRGDRPKAMYFVMSGEVRLVRRSTAGSEIVLQRARHGFIAEASIDQKAYHCDAVAVMASNLVILPRKGFQLVLADEQFRARWIAHLARELRRVRAQAERLGLKTAHDRIIHYIETEGTDGNVELGHSKKDWAAELGLSHEALYRALSRMERSGAIGIAGNVISIMA